STLRVAGKGRVWIDDLRLAEIVRAGVECRADADADPAAFGACRGPLFLPVLPADFFLCDLQHLRIVAGVVDAAIRRRVRKFLGSNVVAQPHFVGGNTEFVRTNINDTLEEPEVLHS